GSTPGNTAPVHAAVEKVASQGLPFTAQVQGRGTFGPDEAKVWFIESVMLQALHDVLLDHPEVAAAVLAADTHAHFVPHVTVGYGEAGDAPASTDVSSIDFDRLAVWDGEDRTEYPLGDAMTTQTAAVTEQFALDEALPWHGVIA